MVALHLNHNYRYTWNWKREMVMLSFITWVLQGKLGQAEPRHNSCSSLVKFSTTSGSGPTNLFVLTPLKHNEIEVQKIQAWVNLAWVIDIRDWFVYVANIASLGNVWKKSGCVKNELVLDNIFCKVMYISFSQKCWIIGTVICVVMSVECTTLFFYQMSDGASIDNHEDFNLQMGLTTWA